MRLRKVEEEGAGEDDFAVSAAFSTRNVFLQQDEDDESESDDDDDDGSPRKSKNKKKKADAAAGGEGEEPADGGAAGSSSSEVGAASSLSTGVAAPAAPKERKPMDDHTRVREYFKASLRIWEEQLNSRPDHIKRMAQGKIETKTQKQCKDYIRPLFKLCKKKEVPQDILINLCIIVDSCIAGEFVKANDAYILTAIGNAAWPIGITSVGMHARSAHDKMQTGQVAHVMNNEMQRKYLQSVKRLIKFEQSRRPDVPPSKKVN